VFLYFFSVVKDRTFSLKGILSDLFFYFHILLTIAFEKLYRKFYQDRKSRLEVITKTLKKIKNTHTPER